MRNMPSEELIQMGHFSWIIIIPIRIWIVLKDQKNLSNEGQTIIPLEEHKQQVNQWKQSTMQHGIYAEAKGVRETAVPKQEHANASLSMIDHQVQLVLGLWMTLSRELRFLLRWAPPIGRQIHFIHPSKLSKVKADTCLRRSTAPTC